MDPNTPEVFDDPISLMAFLQQKNISKVELEDNLLTPYLKEMAGQPIPKAELLDIIRKAPLRKIKSSTYGFRSDVLDGENKKIYDLIPENYQGYKGSIVVLYTLEYNTTIMITAHVFPSRV